MQKARYVVVTPVRDEASHIRKTIDAIKAQTLLPTKWIVVDDGSTDGTSEILEECASGTDWMSVVHRTDRGRRANGGGVVEAFHEGYAALGDTAWDYLVKLDGDLSFAPDYFEHCLSRFADDPQLGIGGGTVYRLEGNHETLDSVGDPPFHVRGATKIYRRDCWQTIGGLVTATGWDTIDEVKANFHGWHTRSFPEAIVIQHKATGAADGAWRNAFKNGRANYVAGYHPVFMAAKCAKRALSPPYLVGALALLCGFVSGYLKRVPRGTDNRVIRYLRTQQVRRLANLPSIYSS